MIPTLAFLLAVQTPAQIAATILAALQAAGFPVSNWISGGVARTIILVLSTVLSDLWSLIASIAASGFALLSSGQWLTLVAYQVYGLTRGLATNTAGNFVLSNSSATPYTITVGQLVITAGNGLTYVNTSGGTLPGVGASYPGELTIAVQASSPGSAYNLGSGTLLTLQTPLPGVTVSNPLQIGAVSQVGVGTGTVNTLGSVVHTGTGTSLLMVPGANTEAYNLLVTVTMAVGAVSSGTGAITYSLNNGATVGPVTVGATGVVAVSGTGLVLNFTTGGSLVLGDTYACTEAAPNIDAVIVVKIVVGGARGTATFQASIDGGQSYESVQTTATSVSIPGNITLAFSAGATTYNAGDLYIFSTSWVTSAGVDQQTDASLQAMCLARWPSLGVAPDSNVYVLWAMQASQLVTVADAVPDPTVPGQVDVFISSGGGSASAGTVAIAQEYIDDRVPLTTSAVVASATPVNLPVTCTLYVYQGFESEALSLAQTNLTDYVAELGIAGSVAYLDDIIAAVNPQPNSVGIRNAVVTAPTSDTTFTLGQAPILVPSISIVSLSPA